MVFHMCISQSDKLVRETDCMKKLPFNDIFKNAFSVEHGLRTVRTSTLKLVC